jgi:PAS domain S-box-containing protein
MQDQYPEELIRIKEILKNSRHGMSVTEIARTLGKNKHSAGRYLDILHASGQIDMRTYGKAKVFSLSPRIPLNTILGFADDLIIVLDKDLRVLQINDHFLNLIKKPRSEIIGKNISYLPFSDQCAETLLTQVNTALTNGIPDQEVKISDKGNYLFFRQKTISTVFESGEQGITVILENVTEQKASETALKSSEEQFRLMAENIRDGLLIRKDGKVIYANKRIEDIFGYSRQELAELETSSLAAPEDRDRLEKTIEDFAGSGNIPSDLTFWIVRKDGSRRFIYNRVTSLEHSESQVLYIVITDVTEWKKAQIALENQLRLLQHLINTFPNPVFYRDMQEKMLGCNAAFAEIIGKTCENIAGKQVGEILSPEFLAFFGNADQDLLPNKGVVMLRGTTRYSDGSRHDISVQKSTFTQVDGTLAGIVTMILSDTLLEK